MKLEKGMNTHTFNKHIMHVKYVLVCNYISASVHMQLCVWCVYVCCCMHVYECVCV